MNPRQVNIEASALWYDPETGVGPPWCEVTIYVDGRRYSASEHANGDDALRELTVRLRSVQEEGAGLVAAHEEVTQDRLKWERNLLETNSRLRKRLERLANYEALSEGGYMVDPTDAASREIRARVEYARASLQEMGAT